MQLSESELPDIASPGCALLQEGRDAAGVSTHAPSADAGDTSAGVR